MKRSDDRIRLELAASILQGVFPAIAQSTGESLSQFAPRAELYAEKALITADALMRVLDGSTPRKLT